MRPTHACSRRRSPSYPFGAFTLVELLTVIAIIAVLAALAMPVIGGMRKRADSAKCMGNLRQLQAVFNTYGAENAGNLPSHYVSAANSPTGKNQTWFAELRSVSNMPNAEFNRLLHCPNVKGFVPGDGVSCYSMTDYLMYRQSGPWASQTHWNPVHLLDPQYKVIIGDGGINKAYGQGGGTNSDLKHPSRGGNPDVRPDFREAGKCANFLFGDGHVEALKESELLPIMFEPYQPHVQPQPQA